MRPSFIQLLEPIVGARLAAALVPTGTMLLVAAIVVVLWVMLARGRRLGLSLRTVVGASIVGILSGFLGARFVVLVQHLPEFVDHPRELFELTGDATSWSGYLWGVLGYWIYLLRSRQPVLVHLDLLGVSLGLGPAIARLGCLMSGCCWGSLGDLAWSVRYPGGSFPHTAHVSAGFIAPDSVISLPVHPVQIYASLAAVAVFVATSWFWRRFRDRPGLTFVYYWFLYGSLRFATEYFRGDVVRYTGAELTQSQFIGLILMVVGLGIFTKACTATQVRPAHSTPPPSDGPST